LLLLLRSLRAAPPPIAVSPGRSTVRRMAKPSLEIQIYQHRRSTGEDGVGDKRIKIAYTFPEAGGAKCIYATKKVLLSFAVSATPVPFVIEALFPGPRFTLVPGSTAGCPTEGKFRGEFSTTSFGEPVEAEVK
jgi:hypothetical protein